jgi:hypothetical protein
MSKPQLIDADFCRAGVMLGCEPVAIAAVASQESLGAGFDIQDRPTILFERHLFHHLTGGVYDKTNPDISNAIPGGYNAGGSQYERFSQAFALNPDAAMKSASWGKFQILGKNYAICGFASVGAFVDAMKVSESNQLDAFCKFVLGNNLDQYLTDKNWTSFALGYNGATEKVHHYDDKIAARYAICKQHNYGCSAVATWHDPVPTAAASPATPDPQVKTDDALASNSIGTQADQSGASSSDKPVNQNADTIVNTGDIAPPPQPTQNITMNAPAPMDTVATSNKVVIGGIVIPTFLVTAAHAVGTAVSGGYISAADIGSAAEKLITENFKYILMLSGLVIVVILVKKLERVVVFVISMLTHAIPSWNSVIVVASLPVPAKPWWKFW